MGRRCVRLPWPMGDGRQSSSWDNYTCELDCEQPSDGLATSPRQGAFALLRTARGAAGAAPQERESFVFGRQQYSARGAWHDRLGSARNASLWSVGCALSGGNMWHVMPCRRLGLSTQCLARVDGRALCGSNTWHVMPCMIVMAQHTVALHGRLGSARSASL